MARDDRRQQRSRRDAGEAVQRKPGRLPNRAGVQRHLSGDPSGRHRRLPRQAAAAHPPGVRRRHRRDDGRRRRHRADRRRAREGRHDLRQEPVPARHRRLLLEARRRHAVVPLQLVLADPLFQQGHPGQGGHRRGQPAEDLGGDLGRGAQDQGKRRGGLRLHDDVADLDPPRELRRVEQPAIRHPAERPRGHRHRPHHQHAGLRQALAGPRRPRQGGRVPLRRPDVGSQADLPRRRMRPVHRVLGRPRRHRQVRHELRHQRAALRGRGRRGAAEHHSRRCEPLGDGWSHRRGLQGRRPVLRLPVRDRHPGLSAPEVWLPAGHPGRLSGDQGLGLLREEPRPRAADPADDGQAADRQLQGRARDQPAAAPRHPERGVRGDDERPAGRPDRPRQGGRARRRRQPAGARQIPAPPGGARVSSPPAGAPAPRTASRPWVGPE